ncbi:MULTISPECIES: pantoate--beta-alanine ligase [Rufibacter]|uniref:Pantothenate synthetase n=1 Tax=Rufibacter quisquiliarum TaxID=1549639 RepID=A0A839GCE3_9BACT|nr:MULTISPECIES: pantoate--beta-alanine ligase [Rufibacter]MBA9076020.1 pantoate--beta-alanine ligase [Rufibacter quisquiliarum]
MLQLSSLSDIRQHTEKLRRESLKIGFVPTMGALHQGHLSLIKAAKSQNDITVCSIFVNPTQFNNAEDYRLYPRLLENDALLLAEAGCDVLFAPSAEEMYAQKAKLSFDFGDLERVMEGAHRPGHFNGVATVVSKLFHLVKPHQAFFGQKDLQQFAIIQQMVQDLSFDLELVCYPIIREADGLAMSSRNRRLTPEQRAVAPRLYEGLQLLQARLREVPVAQAQQEAVAFLGTFPEVRLEYLEVVDAHTLQPVQEISSAPRVALCLAAFLGEVRLIDNLLLQP